MSIPATVAGAFRRQMLRHGSTRSAGILRIALTSLAMAKWAQDITVDRILAPAWLVVFGVVMLLALFFTLFGYKTRWASAVLGVCALIVGFGLNSWAGWQQANFSHHEACLAVCLALLALTPSGGSYSVDRWLAVRRAQEAGEPVPPEAGPMWAWPLLGVALSCVYFYGAVIKCHWGWFNGDRLEQVVMYKFLGSELPRDLWFHAALWVSAWGTVVLEFGLALGLWFRRFRWPLVVAGTLFHLAIYGTMLVYTFSLNMIFMYLVYFDVDAVHRELDRMHGGTVPPASPPQSVA